MSHVCPTAIEIEHHSLRVIASDSYDLQPVTVEKLISNAGERYDFVVDANQNQGETGFLNQISNYFFYYFVIFLFRYILDKGFRSWSL